MNHQPHDFVDFDYSDDQVELKAHFASCENTFKSIECCGSQLSYKPAHYKWPQQKKNIHCFLIMHEIMNNI